MQNFDSQFYELNQFLGCYFHQFWKEALDWQEKKPNFEDVVKFYKSSNSLDNISQATEDLRNFISLNLSEQEIRKIFVRNGIWYGPQYQNMTYHQWLKAILNILEEKKNPKSYLKFKDPIVR